MLNNLKINDINFIYFNKIDEIYISFENSLDNFKEIICLIYKIYYQNDQFEIINNTTKESLRSMLKLLISKNNYFDCIVNRNFIRFNKDNRLQTDQ